jgi:poly(3-hydroxyoctanoate) depolymerase
MADLSQREGARSGHTEHAYLRLGPHRVRVEIAGNGPPLLLIMGLGGNLEMWRPLRAMLPDRQLIAFDAPGTGGSSTPSLPLTIPDHAALASRLLRQLGYEQVDVLGVSWGGVVAQQLAIARRRRVRRLILASTVPGVTAVPGRPWVLGRMLTPMRYYSRSYFEKVAPTIYGGRARRDPAYLQSEAPLRLARPPSLRGYLGQILAISTFTTLPLLPRIKAPTLIVTGDDDPLVPLVNARVMANLIPDARLHVVRGGGHLVLFDTPAEVGAVLRSFLDEPDPEIDDGDPPSSGHDAGRLPPGGL